MAIDVRKWLKDDMGFPDAEITPELVALWEPRAPKIEQGYKRQSDYSRSMDEVTAARTELAAANERLQQEMVEWGSLTAAEKAANQTLQADLLKSQQESQRLTLAVNQLAARAGVDPTTILTSPVTTTPTVVTPPANMATTEHLQSLGGQLNAIAEMALTLPVTMSMIAAEHLTLTGKTLDQRAIIAEIKSRAAHNQQYAKQPAMHKSLNPEDIWNEQHGIAALRTEAATKAHDAEIAAAEERGRVAARTEALMPGSNTPTAHHSKVFNRPDGTVRTSVLARPMPGQTANQAAAAFASGRYRTQTTTPGGNALPAGRTQ